MSKDKIKIMNRELHNRRVDRHTAVCAGLHEKPPLTNLCRSSQNGSNDTPLTAHKTTLGSYAKRAAKPTLPKMPWETT